MIERAARRIVQCLRGKVVDPHEEANFTILLLALDTLMGRIRVLIESPRNAALQSALFVANSTPTLCQNQAAQISTAISFKEAAMKSNLTIGSFQGRSCNYYRNFSQNFAMQARGSFFPIVVCSTLERGWVDELVSVECPRREIRDLETSPRKKERNS